MNETIQHILTYSAVAAALAYLVYALIRIIRPAESKQQPCGGHCGCNSSDLKKKLMDKSL